MDAYEYHPPTELLSVAEIEERRPLVHKIEQTIQRQNDKFRMKQRHLGPAFYIPRKTLDAFIDDSSKHSELQQLLENNYGVSCLFRLDETVDAEATRSESEKQAAESRDKYACIMTCTAYQRMTFIFPFSATSTEAAVLATALCFEHMVPMMGADFCAVYCEKLIPGGFDNRGNICCIHWQMAKWLRMGYWAFESIQEPQKADKGWENALKFHWLPDCGKKLEPADSTESIDTTIDQIIQRLSVAQANGLPPASPTKGTGYIGQWLHGAVWLRSGHTFRIHHDTKEEAIFFRNMINMHWVYLRVGMISC